MANLRLNPATGKLQIVGGGCGGSSSSYTDFIIKDSGTITDTSETEVFEHEFTQNGNKLLKVTGIAKTYGTWRVYLNNILITARNTNSFMNDCEITFWASETFDTNDTLSVTFEAFRYETSLIGPSAETFVRIEGYR